MSGRHQFASLLCICIAAYFLFTDSPTIRHVDQKLSLSEKEVLASQQLTNGATVGLLPLLFLLLNSAQPKSNVSMDLNVDYGNSSPEEEEYLKDKVSLLSASSTKTMSGVNADMSIR